MRELSLHILDIAQNSISAGAETLRIAIIEDLIHDKLSILIKDDGSGMDQETMQKCMDPFYTSRTTRKVGLGIPMFKVSAETCDGTFSMKSQLGVGTEIEATYRHSHIDRVPLGNMADTMVAIILSNPDLDVIYTHSFNDKKFTLSTREIQKILGDVPINNMDVITWLKEYVAEGLDDISSRK